MLARLLKVEHGQAEFVPFVLPTDDDLPTIEPRHEQAAQPVSERHYDDARQSPHAEPDGTVRSQAEAQIAAMLEAARAQANQLILDAEAQVARIERDALERALSEARGVVQAEVNQAVEDQRRQLARSLEELSVLRRTLVAQTERELVRLALEIAKKIVQREIAVDPDIPLVLARVALARVQRVAAVVRLHPDDYEYVTARRAQLCAEATIEIVADAGVGRGGCVIESARGEIDARIEEQFANIERGFLGSGE